MHEAECRVAGICRLFGAVPNNKTRMEFFVYVVHEFFYSFRLHRQS